jgi:hypothetical protein
MDLQLKLVEVRETIQGTNLQFSVITKEGKHDSNAPVVIVSLPPTISWRDENVQIQQDVIISIKPSNSYGKSNKN